MYWRKGVVTEKGEVGEMRKRKRRWRKKKKKERTIKNKEKKNKNMGFGFLRKGFMEKCCVLLPGGVLRVK